MKKFRRYVGIDYSGAKTPTSSLKGLRVYLAESDGSPVEVLPPPSPRKYWTRRVHSNPKAPSLKNLRYCNYWSE